MTPIRVARKKSSEATTRTIALRNKKPQRSDCHDQGDMGHDETLNYNLIHTEVVELLRGRGWKSAWECLNDHVLEKLRPTPYLELSAGFGH